MSWVRLWLDMPTDPKWRVISRKSGQPISLVISTYNFLMVNAAANATERGRTHGWNNEDVAAALDVSEADIAAILDAMQEKVLDGDRLSGWEKRQPKREDSSAERAKRWRNERNRTQPNAQERPDADADADISVSKDTAAEVDFDKQLWDSARAYLGGSKASLIGKWCKEHGKAAVASAITQAQVERPANRVEFISGILRKQTTNGYGPGHSGIPL